MRLGKEIKRDTQLIIISVIVLTVVTLSTSYSAFFSVKSQSTVQKISTGTLNVIIDSTSSAMSSDSLFPTTVSDLPTVDNPVAEGSYATLSLTNNGTLNAEFSVSLGYDTLPADKSEENLISFNYLNIGVYDETNKNWIAFPNGEYYINVTSLTPSGTNIYPILKSEIDASITRQFRVYIWLDENTPTTEIGKLVYLKLDVKSTTVER